MLMAANLSLPADAAPIGAPAAGVDAATFRDAMARLAAAVHVVTTHGADGVRAGFTATAVCSVSDTPPSLLVCLNHKASVYPAFSACSALCVNTLAAGQQPLGNLFGGKTPMDQRFAAAQWDTLDTGAPALAGALVNLDCRIAARTTAGTHDILVCRIVAIRTRGDAGPLVYADRHYRELPASRQG